MAYDVVTSEVAGGARSVQRARNVVVATGLELNPSPWARACPSGCGTTSNYLQGGTEHAHGITATLLSNVAVRAGEIASSLLARQPRAAARPL